MKRALLLFALSCSALTVFSQISNAKLQWSRKQIGQASDFESSVKGYRDPATGNLYVLYQGIYNFGVARLDNSGANTGNYKHLAIGGNNSYGSDLKYIGNNQVLVAGTEYVYNSIVKADMNGTKIWQYQEPVPAVFATYFYNGNCSAVETDQNSDIVYTSTTGDTAHISKLNSAGQLLWRSNFLPTGYDAGYSADVVTDNFNNIIACGQIRNTSGSNFDAFIVSYDENGNKNWEHFLAGSANAEDSASKIICDNSGNTFIGGFVSDSSSTNRTLFVAKYNASGGLQYYKKYHVPLQTNARFGSINLDALGNLYLTGTSYNGPFSSQAWLVKFSSSGNMTWNNTYSNGSFVYNTGISVCADQIGNVYYSGTLSNISSGLADEFVRKINSAGTLQWTQVYNNPNNLEDKTADLLIDNSGNTFIVGSNATSYTNDANVTVNKFSASGLLQWEGFFDTPGNLRDDAVKIIRDGSHAIYTLSTIHNNISGIDAAITKYNAKGVLLWQIMYDNAADDNTPYGMHMDAQKNIYVLANSTSGYDAKLLKYDSLGTFVWEKSYNQDYTTISGDANGNLYLSGGEYGFTDAYCMVVNSAGNTIGSYSPSVAGAGISKAVSSVLSSTNDFYVLAVRNEYPMYHINVVKFNSTGALQWSKDFYNLDSTGFYPAYPYKINMDAAGNIYTASRAKDASHSNIFIHLAKFTPTGTVVWEQKYNDNDAQYMSPDDFSIDYNNQIWISSVGHILKFNPADGSLFFDTNISPQIPGALYGVNSGIVRRSGANELLMTASIGINTNYGGIALIKLDSSANYIWHQVYIPALQVGGQPKDISFTSNGRIYLHCNAYETEGTLTDVTLLKFCDVPVPSISVSSSPVNICPGNPITLNSGSAVGYQWFPNHEITQAIQSDSTGDYYAYAYHTDGCFQSTDTIHVTLKAAPLKPDICLVTVDSLSTHNIIYWDKSSYAGSNIDHFNIYREDVTNLYSFIGITDFDSLSEYHDYSFLADPNVTTKRYKISAVDTCGQESGMSDYHNTIYIVYNGGGQYSWNIPYTIENQPNPVNNYVLMRDDLGNGNWVQIASTAGTQQNINDPAFASFPNGSWRVETVWGISCDPSRAIINTSRSNIKHQITPGGVGIAENQTADYSVYPNPANNVLNFQNLRGVHLIRIYDVAGREVKSEKINGNTLSMEISDIANGMYIIKSYSAEGKLNGVKKLEVMH